MPAIYIFYAFYVYVFAVEHKLAIVAKSASQHINTCCLLDIK